ncbi:MAG: putative oxidoreductase [Gemmatimonadales bacterium]|jgi:putative oxidoreductase|nr:putative oxidoreductase [Gemmatimonadales bacterium]
MSSLTDVATLSSGLLIARLVFGSLMVAHGTQKLFGWFGGYGLTGTGGFFDSLGFRPGKAFAAAASLTEIAGGLLLALGFLGPVGPALIISVMIVAAISVHWKHGLFASTNGIELPLLYAAMALTLALTGPGVFSLDAVLGLMSLWTPRVVLAAIAIGIVGGIANLTLRRTVPQGVTV